MYIKTGFPSPCGDVVLKLNQVYSCEFEFEGFPSPCGDVVLKL